MPMTNMNRSSPTWLSSWRFDSETAGKRNPNTSGTSDPSSEGPSSTPAAISPMTACWPIRENSAPISRATARMTTICSRRIENGSAAWSATWNRDTLAAAAAVAPAGSSDRPATSTTTTAASSGTTMAR